MEIKPRQLTSKEIYWVLVTDEKRFTSIADRFANKTISESEYTREMTNAFNELQKNLKVFKFVGKNKDAERELRNKEIKEKYLKTL